ncbi:MAG: TraR/DksA family transcriptional regulator [Endomicrobium sp.]|nr:TraR/DksA family transcriptional regulator [Endomicrobium sp.]
MDKLKFQNLKKILIDKKIELLNKINNVHKDIIDTNIGDEIDTATNNTERELYFKMIENDKLMLKIINDAFDKLDKNIYGKCESCNNIIPIERLQAIPWTRYCIECQIQSEKTNK